MAKLISSDLFHAIFLPIVFVLLGVMVNMLGKKDSDFHLHKNDLAVGSTVFLLSISTVFSDTRLAYDAKLADLFGWLVLFFFFLMLSLVNDRFGSWERAFDGKPTDAKHFWKGIFIPGALSVGMFILYKYQTS